MSVQTDCQGKMYCNLSKTDWDYSIELDFAQKPPKNQAEQESFSQKGGFLLVKIFTPWKSSALLPLFVN